MITIENNNIILETETNKVVIHFNSVSNIISEFNTILPTRKQVLIYLKGG